MGASTETGIIRRFLHPSTDRWHLAIFTPLPQLQDDVITPIIYVDILNRGDRGTTSQLTSYRT